jgi:ABC-type glycerol-3-phosphate transport system substrate-binding protein
MLKRNGIQFLLLAALLLATAGCQSSQFGDGSQTQAVSKVKTIHPATLTAISQSAEGTPTPERAEELTPEDAAGETVFVWYAGSSAEEEAALREISSRYNRENPWDLTVELVDPRLEVDPVAGLDLSALEKEPPSLILGGPALLAEWEEHGNLTDLSRFLDDPSVGWNRREREDFYQQMLDALQKVDGKRLGVPLSQTIQVLYYNRSWGVELGFKGPPETLEDLREQVCAAAEEYQQTHPQAPKGTGGLLLYPAAANITSWVYAYGGRLYVPEENAYRFVSTEMKNVAREWWLIQQRGCAYSYTQAPNPLLEEDEFADFNNREALLMMGAAADYQQIHIPQGEDGLPDGWSMLAVPGPGGEKAVTASYLAGMIPVTNREQELAAWLYLDYLVSPQVQAEWSIAGGGYPTRESVISLLEEHTRWHPHWAQGLELLAYGHPEPLVYSWDFIRMVLGDAFAAMLQGGYGEISLVLSELEETAVELQAEDWE